MFSNFITYVVNIHNNKKLVSATLIESVYSIKWQSLDYWEIKKWIGEN